MLLFYYCILYVFFRRAAACGAPLIRPCGATFPQRGKA
nr:MAG TPA_asm: hypothetical protein [Bacteriophage sp.]